MKPCVYTIPASLSFVDVLARGIMQQAGPDPAALTQMQILLPTRRACRSLREAFLRLSDKPLLLPRMNPIGDVDEEELSLNLASAEEELSVPPAMPPLQRQILLSRLIAARGYGRGIEQDMALAAALARLMDQVYTENLDLAKLPDLVERAEFAAHWQVSLDFLSLLSVHWPNILIEHGMIDGADRRNRLLKQLAAHWKESPPPHHIIAAGSTGSVPATTMLLQAIADLPRGCIVLPGLDQDMDDASWAALGDTHPQKTLHTLLGKLDMERSAVLPWAGCEGEKQNHLLRQFISESMRPASTAQDWQTLRERLTLTPDDLPIERYDCAHLQDEALVIAAALRRALEDGKKTAALVTPDRKLARRVAMACRRWDIEIDDSGGQALSDTRVGMYLRLALEALCGKMKPVALLDFCKHALCLPPHYKGQWRQDIRHLDATIFRGPAFEPGLRGYDKKIAAWEKKHGADAKLKTTLDFIERSFAPLLALEVVGAAPFAAWQEAHIIVAETFCAPGELWREQDGEAASVLLAELREQASLLPDISGDEYLDVLQKTMATVSVRPLYGRHPRLMILGQLEARLVKADVMVLGGLNEGTWPAAPSVDPWMSRPMRRKFELPPLERSMGLAAHDFAQCLGAEKVILTRSLKVDGAPTVPSRWLQRMDTVLQACGMTQEDIRRGDLLAQIHTMDQPPDYRSVERPAPTPPVSARPRRISVTKIDTWMNDPYSIYARQILKLEPLKPLEQPLDAAMRGTLIHAVMDQFTAQTFSGLPENAPGLFMTIARDELDRLAPEPDVRAFWEPRLSKIAGWIAATETHWRQSMKPFQQEIKGTMEWQGPAGPFVLSGVADRIDQSLDGRSAAIIDYKSAGTFSKTGMKQGQYPQLPLEALILESGGFGQTALPAGALSYWIVSGSKDGGLQRGLSDPADIAEAKDNARAGLQHLIDAFDRAETPYYSLPRPDHAPRFNDYEHLARVREWTALDEPDQEDAA